MSPRTFLRVLLLSLAVACWPLAGTWAQTADDTATGEDTTADDTTTGEDATAEDTETTSTSNYPGTPLVTARG